MQLTKKEFSDNPLTQSQVEKIGNALIYLSDKIKPLFKTNALKLLYLLEEVSVRKNGMPFFGVEFQLWRLGPVVRDVFVDLSSSQTILFKDFIETQSHSESTIIVSKNQFNDDEFSDCDLEVLNLVSEKFKTSTSGELISLTHREHFPWNITAKQFGVLEDLESGRRPSTNIVIDMSTLLDDNPELKEFYISTLEFQKQSNHLKGIA